MINPVRLPTSNMKVNRATYDCTALNADHDPFNRAHLKMDMIEPDHELKAKVQSSSMDQVQD